MEPRLTALALIFFMALASLPGQDRGPVSTGAGQAAGTAPAADAGEAAGEAGAPDTPEEDGGPFPVSPLWETAASGHIPWRPDWPLTIPPDAFRVPAGEVSAISLGPAPGEVSAISLGPVPGEYRLRRGETGGWVEFPVLLQGNFYQAQSVFDTPGAVSKIIILTGEPWELEILAYAGGRPSLIRIIHGGRTYFTVLQYQDRRVSETWYDQEGTAAAVFFLEYTVSGGGEELRSLRALKDSGEETEEYDYDNRGNISALNSPGGEFSALYTSDHRPRYWERRPLVPPEGETAGAAQAPDSGKASEMGETYVLQWDNRGLLVRITGTAGTEPVDLRYEYTPDERGNWIERREIRMLRRFGVLVPAPGPEFKRTIEYRKQ